MRQRALHAPQCTAFRLRDFQMADFEQEAAARIAVAFSKTGTQSLDSINAEGLAVLPRGNMSLFLFLAFTHYGADLRILCSRDAGGSEGAGAPAVHAAMVHNVVCTGEVDFDQVNFLRQFVSRAIAGKTIATQERRSCIEK